MGVQLQEGLQELYLSNNKSLSEISIQALSECLPVLPNLKALYMNQCNIDDQTMVSLCMYLPKLKNLQQLALSQNKFGDEGLFCLTVLLSGDSLENLTTLHLSRNKLGKLGLKKFLEILNFNKTLSILNLSGIQSIGQDSEDNCKNDSMKFIGDLIFYNEYLEEINLSGCGITDLGFQYLIKGIEKNRTLENLHLFNNNLTDKSLKILYDMSQKEQINGIKHLQLFGNKFTKLNLLEELMFELNFNYISDLPQKLELQSENQIIEAKIVSQIDPEYEEKILQIRDEQKIEENNQYENGIQTQSDSDDKQDLNSTDKINENSDQNMEEQQIDQNQLRNYFINYFDLKEDEQDNNDIDSQDEDYDSDYEEKELEKLQKLYNIKIEKKQEYCYPEDEQVQKNKNDINLQKKDNKVKENENKITNKSDEQYKKQTNSTQYSKNKSEFTENTKTNKNIHTQQKQQRPLSGIKKPPSGSQQQYSNKISYLHNVKNIKNRDNIIDGYKNNNIYNEQEKIKKTTNNIMSSSTNSVNSIYKRNTSKDNFKRPQSGKKQVFK
ncbi:hypothetical protein PPERSA_07808 [Pseudocohnilembus persalinus]|uniref:Uncharacterized protein n=1 Tax=Pseudocohnilembus persalinus TaxID=266149 RepID=A0A0V0QBX5_PSEPJ|nr:hypothetical protein PPERSA_07808 [Pseudocohnilembus persalinus]|eukprot:KRW99731.1 hypothetical protein PPERSA_07808 [Pseudocohnilembus persalinus]